ncbi:MAG: peptidoglycan DD-metalloendopeptidase family protein [Elusimicrobia bacterium]|nr:peptidoglycan DD-metalloendopeptidase family protein [Elusimicrobiota bacterium]
MTLFPRRPPGLGVIILFLTLLVSGCATTSRGPSLFEGPSAAVPGVYHKVQKGETLWRIAKTYKVLVEEIVDANRIPNAASIEVGQLILIPGAEQELSVQLPVSSDGKAADYLWPLRGRIVGYFDPSRRGGIDIEGRGQDPVRSSREGRVVLADDLPAFGPTLVIDHADGFFTVYGRNERLLVKLGDYVVRGEAIAQLPGGARPGTLHFEVRQGETAKNPLYYLPQEM